MNGTPNDFRIAKIANTTPALVGKEREAFVAEAVWRAEEARLYPARFQRPVDWDLVARWAAVVAEEGFQWRAAKPWSADAIVLGPRRTGGRVIHSGQHRILGGLMGGNRVPEAIIGRIGIEDPGRGWREPVRSWDLADLLGL
jgi:hypothetical protein